MIGDGISGFGLWGLGFGYRLIGGDMGPSLVDNEDMLVMCVLLAQDRSSKSTNGSHDLFAKALFCGLSK